MITTHRLEQVAEELKQLREAVQRLEVQVNTVITDHPHIIKLPGVQGGNPIIRDKGVTVRTIVALWRQSATPEQIVEEYADTLNLAEVYDALSYYFDHTEEIEQSLAEQRAALERGWQPPTK
ncbi:MAG: DUF433 domain-containing protein [Chloroflexi bacterium]|nr:DUF433 domain-containing protein [Chloroflexota bacterium]